jgi:hypothetical protein
MKTEQKLKEAQEYVYKILYIEESLTIGQAGIDRQINFLKKFE